MYGAGQVRLMLQRDATLAGHAIGAVSKLPYQQLRELPAWPLPLPTPEFAGRAALYRRTDSRQYGLVDARHTAKSAIPLARQLKPFGGRGWGWRILWFVLVMALGNIAISVYVLIQLFRLRPEEPAARVLWRAA